MKPKAAPPRFPYFDHRNMAQIMAQEERAERREKARQAMIGKCRICKGKSPLWKFGRCQCNNTGLA